MQPLEMYALRISGSVLPSIVTSVVCLGLWAGLICAIDKIDVVPLKLSISPVLISTLGFVVSLSLSFRTTTAYARWWESRTLWDRLTSTSRNLARLVWVCLPEESTRDVLLKKSAINLIGIFVTSLKNHLRNERNNLAPDLRHTQYNMPNARTEREEVQRFTWFLHQRDGRDGCVPTLRSHLLPVECAFHLASYGEYVRSKTPTLPQFVLNNFTAYLNTLNDIVSACERIRSTPAPIAYNIVQAQIVWLFCLSLPFQLLGNLSWASIPLTMTVGIFLFSLLAIGTEIEGECRSPSEIPY